PERERRTKRILASERSMRQDLHRIAIADAKQDAANLNAPMRQSIEAIGGGNAKLLHNCARVVDAERAAGGLPDIQFRIQNRGVHGIPRVSSRSLQAYKPYGAQANCVQ